MQVVFKKINDLSKENVEFYSAILGNSPITEFESFVDKDFPDHLRELQIIYSVLNEMRHRGAKSFFFKPEGSANALPKVNQEIINANKKDFGLRLYCIRLTDHVVVLLNGDIKTHIKPQLCPNVSEHFKTALKIAQKIDLALVEKEINFQYDDCLIDFEIEI